ncbi:MAG: CobD/CbiB family protein [Betaproteobacteria bacterium]
MSLLSLIAVFLIEQLRPLDYRRVVEDPLRAWADYIEVRFDAGKPNQGIAAWSIAVAAPVVLLGIVYYLLYALSPVLAWVLNVGVLYLTLGFRQFSHHFGEIQMALRVGDLPRARELLGEWLERPTTGLGSREIASLSIEAGLAAAHRHVFAVLLCFVLLPGPCGALLYRLAAVVAARWRKGGGPEDNEFSAFSGRVFGIIDWLPARATASAFAVVGDFEDALYCWRTQAHHWPDPELGVVLAGGAGALGVRLDMPVVEGVEISDRGELGLGDPADVDAMQSGVGLVWRATLLWMLLLFLLGLASLAG